MQTCRPLSKRSIWERGLWYLPASLPVGVGILLCCLLVFALLQMLSETTEWILTVMAVLSLFTAAYGMGRFASFHRRRYGLKTGVFCALLLYLLLTIVGVFWQHDGGGWLRPLSLLAGGAWGGVSGVNRVHKRPPR